ncbi:MAG TPA: DUF5615 family PIN-like protein [Thermoanaerobaculia bacterium]|nr:DUF5615 family PIN-like protein [Thermoanaerobaculia bacterium]
MFRLAADENFDGRILKALQREIPDLDIVRVQDTRLAGNPDDDLLAWAAEEKRVLVTHDRQTLLGHAYTRVSSGLNMPGVIAVREDCPIGTAVADLQLLLLASRTEELESRVRFVPL